MKSIRSKITDMMIASLGEFQPPWRKPWSLSKDTVAPNAGRPCNFHSGRRYTGINPLLLMDAAKHYGYESKHWGTDKAWMNNLGAVVVDHATHIILFAFIPKRDKTGKIETNKAGETITFPLLREFPLFNIAQVHPPSIDDLLDGRCGKGCVSIVKSLLKVDGARPSRTTKDELCRIARLHAKRHDVAGLTRREIAETIHYAVATNINRLRSVIGREPDFGPAEEFIKATGVEVIRGAHPRYSKDRIFIPSKRSFNTMGDYYDSLFHELCHWGEVRVGYKYNDYNFSELVAEIGACFLMLEIGVPTPPEMLEQSKAYVKSWLRGMKSDSRFIFEASKQASKVVDFLLSLNQNAIEKAA